MEDADPHAFELVLAYIYTDRIYPAKSDQEPRSNEVTIVMMDVYRLALKVRVSRVSDQRNLFL